MKIFAEIDVKNKNRVIIKNYTSELEKYRNILNNFYVDFSSIHKLKGNKQLMEKAFRELIDN